MGFEQLYFRHNLYFQAIYGLETKSQKDGSDTGLPGTSIFWAKTGVGRVFTKHTVCFSMLYEYGYAIRYLIMLKKSKVFYNTNTQYIIQVYSIRKVNECIR